MMSLVPLTDLIMTILQTDMLVSIVAGCEKKTGLFMEGSLKSLLTVICNEQQPMREESRCT
jgi:hypothetical protein